MYSKKKIAGIAGVLLVLLGIFYIAFRPTGEYKEFEIEPGMNARQATLIMEEKGIINFPRLFLAVLKLSNDRAIQAGSYKVSIKENYFSLVEELTAGPNVFKKVTIPEGFTTEQIGGRLESNNLIENSKDFVRLVEEKKLRGFLFPETYMFSESPSEEKIIKTMKKQFNKNFNRAMEEGNGSGERLKELKYTKKEIVTLASLIEKEARVAEERPIISAIFHKRLEENTYLESCASVLFALGRHRKNLTYQDLEVESPYNTYENLGLPPTPICNPGFKSLKAALYPDDTDYKFFFTRGDGTHIFSKTYEEHLEKQKKFNTIINE